MGRSYRAPETAPQSTAWWNTIFKVNPSSSRSAQNKLMTQEMIRRGHFTQPAPPGMSAFRPADEWQGESSPPPQSNPANTEIYDPKRAPDPRQKRFKKINKIKKGKTWTPQQIALLTAAVNKSRAKPPPQNQTSAGGLSTSISDKLANFKFTPYVDPDYSGVDAETAASIAGRVQGLTDIGRSFAEGDTRVAAKGTEIAAKQKATDASLMALTGGQASVLKPEEETPEVRAAMANQATAQNTTMGTRAQSTQGVLSELAQLQATSAQGTQNAITSQQASVRSEEPGLREQNRRLRREEKRQEYAMTHAKEQADYQQLKDQYALELQKQELDIKSKGGGVSPNTLFKDQRDRQKLEAGLTGATREATNKFGMWLDEYNRSGDANAAASALEDADYNLSTDEADQLFNASVQGYLNNGGTGVTRGLKDVYYQLALTDPDVAQALTRVFWQNPKSALKGKRRNKKK